LLSRNDFSGYFGRSFWPAPSRLRDNRRMTDAAHNQHYRAQPFQPARPEVLR